MGIYDREYYRREGPSFLGSITERGKVCKWLILINIVVFVIQLMTQPHGPEAETDRQTFTRFFWLDAPKVFHGEVWRLLTYAFLHDPTSFWHILFNMLFLWWFGTDVEDLYGPREFLAIYLVSAVLGGLAFVLCWKAGLGRGPCLGASGAVTAVLVLCALHYPTQIIWVFVLPLPIWLFVLIQVGKDFLTFVSGVETGTAVTVHLGGAAFGYAYYKLQWRLLNLLPSLKTWQRRRSRPRLRIYREKETPEPVTVAAPPSPEIDEQLEAKLDAVLEKVARSGQDSLTDNERQILLRASEVYKRRRT